MVIASTGVVIGTLGQLSTPELLAKRLQRQQTEREAAAAAGVKRDLRRTLHPTKRQTQQPCSSQLTASGFNPFRRSAKRALQPLPSAAPAEAVGVSTDELAAVSTVEAVGHNA